MNEITNSSAGRSMGWQAILCFVVDRCAQLWGSASTDGRSSTPSEPGWPRPCPSPLHLHGSAFTASSSPRRYERRGNLLCPRCVLRDRTSSCHCHRFVPHHWSTLKHFPRPGDAREWDRDCICLLNLRRDVSQTFRRKWDEHCGG